MKTLLFLGAVVCACTLGAQTRLDLRTQGKGIDFSDAQSTRPAKTGSILPATCGTGELFFLTTAPAGENLYGCVATNIWASPAEIQQTASGDVSGALEALTVTKIRGKAVSSIPPANGEALVWNATAGQWQPTPVAAPSIAEGAVASVAGKTGVVTIAAADLTDCKVTRDSGSVLTVTECRANFPNKGIVTFPPATILATGGQGTAFIYAIPSGQLSVGRSGDLSIVCTGCTDTGGMTGFPPDVKRVWTFPTSSAGIWETGTGSDERGTEPTLVEQGLGILISTANGIKTIAADTAVMQTKSASQAGQEVLCVGSASTASTCRLTPPLTAYLPGMRLVYLAGATNTGAITVSVDSLGAKSILKHDGTALMSGDVTSGRYYTLTYTGTAFHLAPAGSAAPSASSGAPRQVEYIGAKCQNGFSASGFSFGTTDFPTASCVTGAYAVGGVLQFADTAIQAVQDRFTLPASISTASLDIWWGSPAVSGDVVWQLQTGCAAAGEESDVAWNPVQTVTSRAQNTANRLQKATISSLTLTGCSAAEFLRFKFFRDPSNSADTLSHTAELHSLLFTVQP